MQSRIVSVLVAVGLLSFAACGKKDDKAAPAGDKGDKGDKSGEWADVDCDKMVDHVGDVLIAEGTKGKSDADVAAAKAKMKEQHATMVAACVKDKPTKKLTHKQYDCLMAAQSGADMQKCMTP